jgi:hypothetical protein
MRFTPFIAFVARRPKPIVYCKLIYFAALSWLGNRLRHKSGTAVRKGGTQGMNSKSANRNVKSYDWVNTYPANVENIVTS